MNELKAVKVRIMRSMIPGEVGGARGYPHLTREQLSSPRSKTWPRVSDRENPLAKFTGRAQKTRR